MLPFEDENWQKLDSSGLIRELLTQVKNNFNGEDKTELLYGQLCHQFSIAVASYAVMPYLLDIAEKSEDVEVKVETVLFGGTINAFSNYDESNGDFPKIIDLHKIKINPEILKQIEIEYFYSLEQLKRMCLELLESYKLSKQNRAWLFTPLVSFLGQRKFSGIFENGSFDEYVFACSNCKKDIYLWEEQEKLVGYTDMPMLNKLSKKFEFLPAKVDRQSWDGKFTDESKEKWMLFLAEKYGIEPLRFQLPYMFSKLNCPYCNNVCDIFEGLCDYL